MRLQTIFFTVLVGVVGSGLAVPNSALALAQPWCNGGSVGVNCPAAPYATGGSNLIQHPEIVPIFWQDPGPQQWTNNSNSPTMGQLIGMTLDLVNMPWSAALSQYGYINGHTGMIARPRMAPWAQIYSGTAPSGHSTSNFTLQDIEDIINYEIYWSSVPPPLGPTDDVVYAVFLPSTACGGCGSGCGANGCNHPGAFGGATYTYLYVRGNYGQTLAHETAEAITGAWQGVNVTTSGGDCTFTGGGSASQIADLCQCANDASYNGSLATQAYWSQQLGKCVIPEQWNKLIQNEGEGYGWSYTSGYPQQMYGGAGGVVFTQGSVGSTPDTYFWSTTNSTMTTIGTSAGAEFAAAGSHILQLPLDTSQALNYFTLPSHPYQTLPSFPTLSGYPTPTPITSVVVTNEEGGAVVVTDPNGEVWAWAWKLSPPQWVPIGMTCDHVIASGSGLLCLNPLDRETVYYYGGSQLGNGGKSWSILATASTPMVELISDPEAGNNWGTLQAGSQAFYSNATTLVRSDVFELASTSNAYDEDFLESEYSDQMAFDLFYYLGSWYRYSQSGPVGRVTSGFYAYATTCAGMSVPCVSY